MKLRHALRDNTFFSDPTCEALQSIFDKGYTSTQVDEGRKSAKYFRDKLQGANRSREEEKNLLFDPGSELRLGGRENRKEKILDGFFKKIDPNMFKSTRVNHEKYPSLLRLHPVTLRLYCGHSAARIR